MNYFWIATFFSFISACFTVAASWTKDPHRTYHYQVFQCLVYSVAAFFYGIYPCILVMLINATRNYLVATERYRKIHSIIFSILAVIIGLLVNTSGLTGLVTIFATVEYSILSFYLKKDTHVKLNVIINLLIWLVYDILVLDFFSFTIDSVGIVLAVISIIRIVKGLK